MLVVVGTVLFGKKIDGRSQAHLPAARGRRRGGRRTTAAMARVKLPGTIVLVAIFFTCFVLYYFINWKYLSELWLFR